MFSVDGVDFNRVGNRIEASADGVPTISLGSSDIEWVIESLNEKTPTTSFVFSDEMSSISFSIDEEEVGRIAPILHAYIKDIEGRYALC